MIELIPHPSSTTIFVYLFIGSVIQKVTIVTPNIIFSVVHTSVQVQIWIKGVELT